MGEVRRRDFVQSHVKPFLFRQWIACVVMTTVLFGPVVPQGVCQCAGCVCGNSSAQPVLANNKNGCCKSTEKSKRLDRGACLENWGCWGSPTMPFACHCFCSCSCNGIQQNEEKGVLPIQRPDIPLLWDAVLVSSVIFVPVSWGCLENHRIFSPPHVPLHVLLCVFLN